MLNKDYHRLLKRQLKKTGLDTSKNPDFISFFNMVNDAYKSFDKDLKHIENILEESSKELFVANKGLIKERDNVNRKLERIVDNIGGVLFKTDLDGNFTFLNNAWTEYSGIPVNYALGKSFRIFLHGENIEGFKRFDDLFSKEKEHVKFIFKNKRGSEVMWFEVKSKLIKDHDGVSIGFIGTIIDVTNLKETEIELQKASKSKDEFLSTMSHEIRTPLNAVTGLANILLMEDHLPHQLENLKALKYSGEHLLGLINDLLDFDKIKSGKLKLVEKDFSLNYFLESVKSHFSLRTEKKGLIFNVIKENDVPDNIIGDKLKLTQIIKNLLSNSLKFTENGCINLSVKNLGIKENKVKLVFKVIDTGIGISKNKQESIFESFMQANSETSIKYGGTGLGLSISKKLLNLQGSDLVVESELGKGSTFFFEITYKVSNRLNIYEPDMIKMQPDYEPININVLVAEDNKMNVLILKRFFNKWGVKYTVAENGEQVLKLFEKFDYDLILMDLQMPKINGYQAAKMIREWEDESKASIPIIALTAFAQIDIKKKTEQYKMNGFMGKPFNPEELYKLLKSYGEAYNIKAI
ncbi:PAS domain-containing sensor histidine kinase [Flavivirga sp. 57AJ16]|uniref:PAS domain-containing sensor histidine kinase n=1 Tax=Flavivirga sp. 57AJ16 TaxID=3025307 RepID=UPI0023667589|nr:PAS domain-containing sensor histidine kinase [Flavivirga sp. 57AJ16]MDD7885320.1 ATP-binding protein [Flavivirga sp. 57AJ16]